MESAARAARRDESPGTGRQKVAQGVVSEANETLGICHIMNRTPERSGVGGRMRSIPLREALDASPCLGITLWEYTVFSQEALEFLHCCLMLVNE